jgi:hypothetical protein
VLCLLTRQAVPRRSLERPAAQTPSHARSAAPIAAGIRRPGAGSEARSMLYSCRVEHAAWPKRRTVKGPWGKPSGLAGWVTPCDASEGPALTRLSSGGSGQTMEATTLPGGSRPTSACFLNADHSNPRLQTSSGSCTKRAGEQRRLPTLPRGESWERPPGSVTPEAVRPMGGAPLRGCGWGPRGVTPLGGPPDKGEPRMQQTQRGRRLSGLKAPKELALLPGLKFLGFRAYQGTTL